MSRAVYLSIMLMLVTAPCRLLPMIFLSDLKMPKFFNSLFYYIPFAVLSALVLPDIFSSTGNPTTAAAGAAAAIAVSLFTDKSMYVMLVAVIVTYIAFFFV